MKKLIAGVILLGASSAAFAQPGCGVGAMLWKGQSGIVPHVLGATTNGMASQTVSMTLGIAGCNTNEAVQSMAMYMNSNIDKVARDMSRGSGESLDALAAILNIQDKDLPTFRETLQDNFSIVFPTTKTTSNQAVDSILAVMEKDQTLNKYVPV